MPNRVGEVLSIRSTGRPPAALRPRVDRRVRAHFAYGHAPNQAAYPRRDQLLHALACVCGVAVRTRGASSALNLYYAVRFRRSCSSGRWLSDRSSRPPCAISPRVGSAHSDRLLGRRAVRGERICLRRRNIYSAASFVSAENSSFLRCTAGGSMCRLGHSRISARELLPGQMSGAPYNGRRPRFRLGANGAY
jgi:hypothetical protein